MKRLFAIAGGILLHALRARFGVEQGLEYRQHMPAVLHHACENVAERGFAFGLAMPLEQHRLRHLDVAAKFLSGMSSQEQSVKERGFPLGEVEVVQSLVGRPGRRSNRRVGLGLHWHPTTERAVYPKVSLPQVEQLDRTHISVIPAT